MNTQNMIIYWREAAEAAEAKIIEMRRTIIRLEDDVKFEKANAEDSKRRAWSRVQELENQIKNGGGK